MSARRVSLFVGRIAQTHLIACIGSIYPQGTQDIVRERSK